MPAGSRGPLGVTPPPARPPTTMQVPLCEPMGWGVGGPGTLLGYQFSTGSVVAIAVSSVLGLLVNLSTFLVRRRRRGERPAAARAWCGRPAMCWHPLCPARPPPPPTRSAPPLLPTPQVIGATSSLTYNVVGHVKTVLILTGGVLFFGDTMPPKKVAGIGAAMGGIVWYSQIKLGEARQAAAAKLLPQAVSLNGEGCCGAAGLGGGGPRGCRGEVGLGRASALPVAAPSGLAACGGGGGSGGAERAAAAPRRCLRSSHQRRQWRGG